MADAAPGAAAPGGAPKSDALPRLVRLSGRLALLVLVAGLAFGAKIILDSRRENASAALFAAQAVIDMARDWDASEMARRAAPRWLSAADLQQLPAVFRQFSALGRLQDLQPPVGRVGKGAFPGTDINGPWAEYSVAARFDTGPATFHMVLKRVGDGWQMSGFQIDAEVLRQARQQPLAPAPRQ
ncbi:MAG TPA: hypothetical protein VHA15_04540 [Burkholderiales bacterium]|jgi:hypothetical protein|nr:hypothetical protein [Burkholderiales bacterium]